jgi:UDP-2,3-diacylglucosamine hydrolase
MSISIISDIHIQSPNSSRYKLLISFLKHPKVYDSKEIYLLGDIFDFMSGDHDEYFQIYEEYFICLKNLFSKRRISKNYPKVFIIEGNHDFNLSKLYSKFKRNNFLPSDSITISQSGLPKNYFGNRYFFCHGDELISKDYINKLLKSVLTGPIVRVLIERFVPFNLLDKIGVLLSLKSRKNNIKKKYDYGLIRKIYRHESLRFAQKNNFDIIVAGHCHVKDLYTLHFEKKSFKYINNGYAPDSKTFIYIEKNKIEFLYL